MQLNRQVSNASGSVTSMMLLAIVLNLMLVPPAAVQIMFWPWFGRSGVVGLIVSGSLLAFGIAVRRMRSCGLSVRFSAGMLGRDRG
jgi:hypothetical protein